LENIEWLVENLSNIKNKVKFVNKSRAIKYIVENKILNTENSYYSVSAVYEGNLEMMKLLLDNGFKFSDYIFCHVVQDENLEVMKWLLKNNFPLYEKIFTCAILKNNLDNIKWLYENKCPFSENISYELVKYGHIDVINWFLENKFPIDNYVINDIIIDDIEKNTCLRKYNLYFPTIKNLQIKNFKAIYEDAFGRKNLKNIALLLMNNIPYDIDWFKIVIKNKLINFKDL